MADFDVFNGDADGICSLQQLRLVEPRDAELVTGIKRDIKLLDRIWASQGDRITALDISFDKNRDSVNRLISEGADIFYADHHFAGEMVESDHLDSHIHTDTDTCTSLIINGLLSGQHAAWAVAGAFGDNLDRSAEMLANRASIGSDERDRLKQLGICLNYNGYGFSLDDLVYHPDDLYKRLSPFSNPLEFYETRDFQELLNAYKQDMDSTIAASPVDEQASGAIYILPNESWARRVSGVFSNDLANDYPDRAHAVLIECGENCYRVSVRAPLNRKTGADELCREFETGGGRKAAAGINKLPEAEFGRFTSLFHNAFGK